MLITPLSCFKPFVKINFGTTVSREKEEHIKSDSLKNDIFEKKKNVNEKNEIGLRDINIICKDEIENPTIYLFMSLKKDVYKNNEQTDFVHNIIVNNKVNELEEKSDLFKNNLYMQSDYKGLEAEISNDNLFKELRNIKGAFIDLNISEEDLNYAKEIAKEFFALSKKTKNVSYPGIVINNKLSYESFCEKIDKIDLTDIREYHKDFLRNSDINITTYISKDFYNKHPNYMNEINDIFAA